MSIFSTFEGEQTTYLKPGRYVVRVPTQNTQAKYDCFWTVLEEYASTPALEIISERWGIPGTLLTPASQDGGFATALMVVLGPILGAAALTSSALSSGVALDAARKLAAKRLDFPMEVDDAREVYVAFDVLLPDLVDWAPFDSECRLHAPVPWDGNQLPLRDAYWKPLTGTPPKEEEESVGSTVVKSAKETTAAAVEAVKAVPELASQAVQVIPWYVKVGAGVLGVVGLGYFIRSFK